MIGRVLGGRRGCLPQRVTSCASCWTAIRWPWLSGRDVDDCRFDGPVVATKLVGVVGNGVPPATPPASSSGRRSRRQRTAHPGGAAKQGGADGSGLRLLYLDECQFHPHLAKGWQQRVVPRRIPAAGTDQRVTYVGALDFCSGIVTTMSAPTGNAQQFQRFVDHLADRWPNDHLVFVLANASTTRPHRSVPGFQRTRTALVFNGSQRTVRTSTSTSSSGCGDSPKRSWRVIGSGTISRKSQRPPNDSSTEHAPTSPHQPIRI